MAPFAAWQNFYVIVGSSAGALIGLQFVVMALVSDLAPSRLDPQAGTAFSTPTIVHFGVVLLLAAGMSAPWQGSAPAAFLWGAIGSAGLVYEATVLRRVRAQQAYRPELEDWIFHAVLPFAAYAALGGAGIAVGAHPREASFAVAAAALLLLFIGIHNAWDAVTYHVFVQRRRLRE